MDVIQGHINAQAFSSMCLIISWTCFYLLGMRRKPSCPMARLLIVPIPSAWMHAACIALWSAHASETAQIPCGHHTGTRQCTGLLVHVFDHILDLFLLVRYEKEDFLPDGSSSYCPDSLRLNACSLHSFMICPGFRNCPDSIWTSYRGTSTLRPSRPCVWSYPGPVSTC